MTDTDTRLVVFLLTVALAIGAILGAFLQRSRGRLSIAPRRRRQATNEALETAHARNMPESNPWEMRRETAPTAPLAPRFFERSESGRFAQDPRAPQSPPKRTSSVRKKPEPPTRDRNKPAKGSDPFEGMEKESPLKRLGYQVGKSSPLLPRERREILRAAVTEHFPNDYPREYIERWGTPLTKKRVRQIAYHLDYLIERDGRRFSHRHAVADRKADREWLEQEFPDKF